MKKYAQVFTTIQKDEKVGIHPQNYIRYLKLQILNQEYIKRTLQMQYKKNLNTIYAARNVQDKLCRTKCAE